LTRRIRLLEDDLEQTESRFQEASTKLAEASKAADEVNVFEKCWRPVLLLMMSVLTNWRSN